ncbi:MAG: FtsK/SpoIIIE domain-containing protein, partial [Micrococcales bacterium]|nr:FtsK/SpoIIIE domain-containing protein [Micrococcales bacterium]
MRWKINLRRDKEPPTTILLTTDVTARVGDLAEVLATGQPHVTLRVDDLGGTAPRVLEPGSTLHDAGLRSGSTVEVIEAARAVVDPRRTPAARLRVLTGPDAGKEFPLPIGTAFLGRHPQCEVPLADPMVSSRHARITVGDHIEIADLNSANGMVLAGQYIQRSTLAPTDEILLGDSLIAVTRFARTAAPVPTSHLEFSRAPRVVPPFAPDPLACPAPPSRPSRRPMPWLAALAPFLMGAAMFAVTRSLFSVVFMALSPLMMIGSFLDQGVAARRELKEQLAIFTAATAATRELAARLHQVERSVREQWAPSAAEVLQAVSRLSPLLWTRRPESEHFGVLRMGVGTSPSRCVLETPQGNNTLPQHWQEVLDLREEVQTLEGGAVLAGLRECGAVGVAGPPGLADDAARALMWQLVGLHSPAELVLTAVMSRRARVGWEWLVWLPHTTSPHSPLGSREHLADSSWTCGVLVALLEDLVEVRAAQDASPGGSFPAPRGPLEPTALHETPPPVVPSVIVLISDDAPVDRSRLTRLAECGPDVGIHVLWLAGDLAALPAACRTFLLTQAHDDGATLGQVRLGQHTYPLEFERVDATTSVALARFLAPVIDAGVPVDDSADLPRSLSYLTLAEPGIDRDPEVIASRWEQTQSIKAAPGTQAVVRKTAGGLRALVGMATSGPFALDLRSMGPHALVGGTTGSGKSEFLQTWVMGLATAYSPDRVTFLLVDYKGGSAFADCVNLPHCVGLVTDLTPHLVRRALTSLRAELKHREQLLNRKRAKDLLELERAGDPDCPPALVIVVDEFAALVSEVPEFVDGLVDVGARGRSLGLHLILATQRPAGVIRDNLRANTNLRIALRVADEDDSVDVLGVPMAGHFDPSIPGRAAAKSGPGRITPFQSGYLGGWTSDEPEPVKFEVADLPFGTGRVWELGEVGREEEAAAPVGPNDIARCVAATSAAADLRSICPPRRPWLDPLADTYDVADLNGKRDDQSLLVGVLDEPELQSQRAVYYEPDRDGNMVIIGTGGSGKSTALRTLAASAAFSTRHGGPVHVYCLDFAAGGLRMLEDLPHVGAVIAGDDEERVIRLLRLLRMTVEERAVRYAKADASTIVEYRRLAGKPSEPRILLLVDGVAAFREEYEYTNKSAWFTVFAQIAADGRQLGVHVVMTGDRPSAVPSSISATVQRRIVLRLASEDDYAMVGAPSDVLGLGSPPGRGVLEGKELQVAVLGGDSNVAVQARVIRGVAAAGRRRGLLAAPPVLRLPTLVALEDLPVLDSCGLPSFGLSDETLGPLGFEAGGPMIVAGPRGSGATTTVVCLARAA